MGGLVSKDGAAFGDQYTFIALASSARAIVAYRTGKRIEVTTDEFIRDLRERVLGSPEISTEATHRTDRRSGMRSETAWRMASSSRPTA